MTARRQYDSPQIQKLHIEIVHAALPLNCAYQALSEYYKQLGEGKSPPAALKVVMRLFDLMGD